jgi:hypothetical protein
MRANVNLETAGISEALLAKVAHMFSLVLLVHLFDVQLEIVLESERLGAELAGEGLLAVGLLVGVQG